MFERFTDRGRSVLVLAQEEARHLHHPFIGTEHILLGLLRVDEGAAARALASLGVTLDAVRAKLDERTIRRGSKTTSDKLPFTPRAKKVLELSLREALQLGHNYVGTEHILLGVVREGKSIAVEVLQSLGVDPPRVREAVISQLNDYESNQPVQSSDQAESLRGEFHDVETVRYPLRLVPGPREPILLKGLECRIVGLLVFEDGFEIVWSVAGDHDTLWSQLGVLENDDHPPLGTTPRLMTVIADDLGTVYESDSHVFTRSPSRWSGHVTCWPVPPVKARVLRLTWIDRLFEVQL